MHTPPAPWAIPGATVYELHCSTHDYSVKKTTEVTVVNVGRGRIVLDNGARYFTIDGNTDGDIRYQRDDPRSRNRYYLLVGPNDPHITDD
ncbi:hypothetical protein ACFYY5_29185 [Nocardia elegans]|uniref:Uncharacterized protein n=1 Tax=Nocardia elegans TaxID=300029 RepID=A0ABW6TLB5_9NOCA